MVSAKGAPYDSSGQGPEKPRQTTISPERGDPIPSAIRIDDETQDVVLGWRGAAPLGRCMVSAKGAPYDSPGQGPEKPRQTTIRPERGDPIPSAIRIDDEWSSLRDVDWDRDGFFPRTHRDRSHATSNSLTPHSSEAFALSFAEPKWVRENHSFCGSRSVPSKPPIPCLSL